MPNKIPCDRKDQTCNSIIALTAFKTTEAFSSAGHHDTSFELEGMGENSTVSVVKKCEVDGGRREISDTIEINVGVDLADRKIVAKLTGIAEKDIKHLGKSHIGARVYMGWMQADWMKQNTMRVILSKIKVLMEKRRANQSYNAGNCMA